MQACQSTPLWVKNSPTANELTTIAESLQQQHFLQQPFYACLLVSDFEVKVARLPGTLPNYCADCKPSTGQICPACSNNSPIPWFIRCRTVSFLVQLMLVMVFLCWMHLPPQQFNTAFCTSLHSYCQNHTTHFALSLSCLMAQELCCLVWKGWLWEPNKEYEKTSERLQDLGDTWGAQRNPGKSQESACCSWQFYFWHSLDCHFIQNYCRTGQTISHQYHECNWQ